MANPTDLKYAKTHEWLRVEGGEAVIGITDFAQDALGDIIYVELPAVGDTLEAGKEFGSVESVKAASDLYAPASGTVVAINTALEAQPELLNQEPFTGGWLVRMTLDSESTELLDATAYADVCAAEAH